MSSTATPTTRTYASPSASTSSNSNSSGFQGTTPNSFYKNLFYILIGLLCAFGCISFFSLIRARRRRRMILAEAERLGVVVPGVPGYIPVRDRRQATWAKSDGTDSPDWWEVEKNALESHSDGNANAQANQLGFQPLAIIPPVEPEKVLAPTPASTLKYFPNHLAYRPAALLAPPTRFRADEPETLDGLDGEGVSVVTIIRMPGEAMRPKPEGDDEDAEEVLREWGGVELGIARFAVKRVIQ